MTFSISVFALVLPKKDPVFCYAQLRELGRQPPYGGHTLPKDIVPGLSAMASRNEQFELRVWDSVLSDAESAALAGELETGRLTIPASSPFFSQAILSGTSFAEHLIDGEFQVGCAGVGALRSKGFALKGGGSSVINGLRLGLGRTDVGAELNELVALLDEEAGLHGLMKATGRLGVVERLSREHPLQTSRPVSVSVIKPDLRSQDPCLDIRLSRSELAVPAAYRISIKAKSGDATVLNRLIDMPANVAELVVSAAAHVTNLTVEVYDETNGELIDQEVQRLLQKVGIDLVAQGSSDALPPLFNGAAAACDLTSRPRLRTGKAGISGLGRSGGFDIMREGLDLREAIGGRRNFKPETRFFPAGRDSQLEVIRWIKAKLEAPSVTEAFLIDPFLGSQALSRVVLRHGNEDVKLTILVSPGNLDPDAETMDAEAGTRNHVHQLADAATAVADQLCGEIEILHVIRGTGNKQAFHDRYLGLVRNDGSIQVFLLSNSLSKAAGDWPFAIAELDTPTAWSVEAYLRDLTAGNSAKSVTTASVWKSGRAEERSAPTVEQTALQNAMRELYFSLSELRQMDRHRDRELADPLIDAFVTYLPGTFDAVEMARSVVEGVFGRDVFLTMISQRLAETEATQLLATSIDDLACDRQIDGLKPKSGFRGGNVDVDLLKHAGRILSARPGGTNMIRDLLNPLAERYALSAQINRSQGLVNLHTGLAVAFLALATVDAGTKLPAGFRRGIVKDYLNVLGRLLTSALGRESFGGIGAFERPWVVLSYKTLRLARDLAPALGLGDDLERLIADPLLPKLLLTESDRRNGLIAEFAESIR